MQPIEYCCTAEPILYSTELLLHGLVSVLEHGSERRPARRTIALGGCTQRSSTALDALDVLRAHPSRIVTSSDRSTLSYESASSFSIDESSCSATLSEYE